MGLFDTLRDFFDRGRRLPPNVVRSPDGGVVPAPGFGWVSDRTPGDFRVHWVPGAPWVEKHFVASDVPGIWLPAPGYAWLRPRDPGCEEVRWVPGSVDALRHLVAGSQRGQWLPDAGYKWTAPSLADSFDVRWVQGLAHPSAPHVVASPVEGKWATERGYRWLNQEAGDLRVERSDGAGCPDRDRPSSEPRPSGADLQQIRDLAMLGLELGASRGDVESAFRRLVRVHHPDRFASEGEAAVGSANRTFVILRAAYERLVRDGGGS